MSLPSEKKVENYLPALIFSLGFRVLLTQYWLARFGGFWLEDDTSRTTPSIQAVFDTGVIAPHGLRVYSAGFLYQVYGTVFARITGLDVLALQRWVFPWVGLLLTLVAFTFYLRIFRNPTAAAIAVTLLNLQGDFLFTTMRGSHEKLDFLLIFVSLLIIALSVERFESMTERIALAIIYYLTILAENTSNVFFASTFTVTLILSFVLWSFFSYYTKRKIPGVAWFLYVAVVSTVFTFIVIFVWYPPARALVVITGQLTDRIRLFLFSPVETSPGLLSTVNASWTLPYAWLWLRLFDVSLLLLAGLGWIDLVRQLLPGSREAQISPVTNNFFWLLILLPAFAFQNFVVIFSDLTGSVGEIDNLQIRLIPLTVFAAAPTAVYALLRLLAWLRVHAKLYILFKVALPFIVLVSLSIAVIKGTAEPLLSNNWLFYTPSEYAGVLWMNQHIPMVAPDSVPREPLVLVDADARIGRLWLDQFWGPKNNFIPITTRGTDNFTYVFISPGIQIITARYGAAPPDLHTSGLIYTNGSVQVYFHPVGTP